MTTALICVGSPLQAICAIEAIFVYRIDIYKLFVIDDGFRLEQIKKFLDERKVVFSVIPYHVHIWKNIYRLIGLLNPFIGCYDYLLMGDYRLIGNRMEYIPLIKNGGKIIYLDDGTYIISLAKGQIDYSTTMRFRNKLMDVICKYRRISDKNLFTIFANDIAVSGFDILENQLLQLQMKSFILDDTIYFIGTSPIDYCTYMGIYINQYVTYVENILSIIKERNPETQVIYIPHGRDMTKETQMICKKLDIVYRRIPICIEIYMLSLSACPKEVWGIGSTALFTLKRMLPNTKFTNVTIKGTIEDSVRQYKEIASLYTKNGINHMELN